MTESPIRRYPVVQTREEVVAEINAATSSRGEASILLRVAENDTMTVVFRVTQSEHADDGSHLYVGITDLDVIITLVIDEHGEVSARLK